MDIGGLKLKGTRDQGGQGRRDIGGPKRRQGTRDIGRTRNKYIEGEGARKGV